MISPRGLAIAYLIVALVLAAVIAAHAHDVTPQIDQALTAEDKLFGTRAECADLVTNAAERAALYRAYSTRLEREVQALRAEVVKLTPKSAPPVAPPPAEVPPQ